MKEITAMKLWMSRATSDEQIELAERVGTSRAYLYQIAGGYRRASVELAAALERETGLMHVTARKRLPRLYRVDLVEACRQCPYAQACLKGIAVRSEFPMTVPTKKD